MTLLKGEKPRAFLFVSVLVGAIFCLVLAGPAVSPQAPWVSLAAADAPATAGTYVVRLHPQTIVLRNGKTSEKLRLEVRDPDGGLITPVGRRIAFASSKPGLIKVDAEGVVSGTGFGTAEITVEVEGVPVRGKAKVIAGHLRITPPILMLSTTKGQPTGRVTLDAANADGTPLDLSGHRSGFNSETEVIGVGQDGTVNIRRLPDSLYEIPKIWGRLDTMYSSNFTLVRVTKRPLGPQPEPYFGEHVAFHIPPETGRVNLVDLLQRHQVIKVTDAVYKVQAELTGFLPYDGDLQHFVYDYDYNYDTKNENGMYIAAIAGNPVQMFGYYKGSDRFGGFFEYKSYRPSWLTFSHEMGHNFLDPYDRRFPYANSGSGLNRGAGWAFREGLANLIGIYALETLTKQPDRYGLTRDQVGNLLNEEDFHYGSDRSLAEYMGAEDKFSTLDPNIAYLVIATLANDDRDKGGYGRVALYRFFSILIFDQNRMRTDRDVATYVAAAMSAATGADLKSKYRDEWGFPIDEPTYARIHREMLRWARERDPAVDAGRDRQVPAGQSVTLDDAYAFDWENDRLSLRWRIVRKPAGSNATLAEAASLNPHFTPDMPGEYVLELTADDGTITGLPDKVKIVAESVPR